MVETPKFEANGSMESLKTSGYGLAHPRPQHSFFNPFCLSWSADDAVVSRGPTAQAGASLQSQPHPTPASNLRKALLRIATNCRLFTFLYIIHFLMPFSSTVPSSMPYFLIDFAVSMSNSSVAPANIMMDFFPPGC